MAANPIGAISPVASLYAAHNSLILFVGVSGSFINPCNVSAISSIVFPTGGGSGGAGGEEGGGGDEGGGVAVDCCPNSCSIFVCLFSVSSSTTKGLSPPKLLRIAPKEPGTIDIA